MIISVNFLSHPNSIQDPGHFLIRVFNSRHDVHSAHMFVEWTWQNPYGELAAGKRPAGRPELRFKDICKRDLKSMNIDTNSRKTLAKDRSAWREAVKDDTFEETLTSNTEERRRRRKKKQQEGHKDSTFICPTCGKDCHSRIGLSNHSRRCFQRAFPSLTRPMDANMLYVCANFKAVF